MQLKELLNQEPEPREITMLRYILLLSLVCGCVSADEPKSVLEKSVVEKTIAEKRIEILESDLQRLYEESEDIRKKLEEAKKDASPNIYLDVKAYETAVANLKAITDSRRYRKRFPYDQLDIMYKVNKELYYMAVPRHGQPPYLFKANDVKVIEVSK